MSESKNEMERAKRVNPSSVTEMKDIFEWVESTTVTDEKKSVIKNEILALDLIKDVGFASISAYERIPGGSTPFEFLSDAKTAIVYIALTDDILNTYGKWYVVSLNNFMKKTNDKIVALLKKHQLYSRGVIDERITDTLIGKISFRQLAVLAGLGTIGKNTCLLHPVYGPHVVLGVVLTNAHFPGDSPLNTQICLDCDVCLEKCPTKAIHHDSFDRHTCKNRRKILGKGCKTPCIDLCPLNRGNLKTR
ncbi:MAG: epoxyqueuosine reductase [Theionarchaea archaeon]|nr:epoxyqueuosine reductase [Theionarchaea archaeon]